MVYVVYDCCVVYKTITEVYSSITLYTAVASLVSVVPSLSFEILMSVTTGIDRVALFTHGVLAYTIE